MSKTIKALAGFLLLATIYNPVFAEIEKTQIEKDLSASGVKLGVAFDQGFGVTAQFDNNINAFIGNEGVSADYILKQGPLDLDVVVNWYVGVGGAINWDDNSHHNNDSDSNKASCLCRCLQHSLSHGSGSASEGQGRQHYTLDQGGGDSSSDDDEESVCSAAFAGGFD